VNRVEEREHIAEFDREERSEILFVFAQGGLPSLGAILQVLSEQPSIRGELQREEKRLKTQKSPLEGTKNSTMRTYPF
jgi:hypothetical protein